MSRSPQNQGRPRSAAADRSRPGAQRPRQRKRNDIVEIAVRLLDEAETAWQWAELECEQTLRAWCDGSAPGAGERYLSYRAALDREEAAARDLQRLWEVARLGSDALASAAS